MQTKAFAIPVLSVAMVVSACTVNVKKNKQGDDDKNVDIKTPFGEIHVDKDADSRDVGLPVYAGARLREKGEGGSDKSANVNLSAFGFGLKVVAMQYESDDPPSKVAAFYQDQLKKYGTVLQCHTSKHGDYNVNSNHHDASEQLKCEGDNSGNVIELKVGTEDNQHVVAIEPKDKGTNFSLVYVRTRGKDDTI